MTIAVTGATGHLGRLAIAALQARGVAPVALARDPSRAADLPVEVRAFDYVTADPAALEGVETLVQIAATDLGSRVVQHGNVVAAARAAGVKRLVFTSILRADTNPMRLAADYAATEEVIRSSGLPATILRNGWYTENYTGSLAATVQHGALLGAAGDGRVSSAARQDFAEAIAVTALDTAHVGKTYELAGDMAHTGADFAAAIARAAGKPVAYVSVGEADFAQALIGFGLPEALARMLADSDARASEGALYDDSRTLSRLIGRPTTPYAETIAASL